MSRKLLNNPGGVLAVVFAGVMGCRQDMHDQPKIEPLEASPFFADGRGARTPVDQTVARGQLKADKVLYEGREPDSDGGEGELVDYLPFPATREVLQRGQERYDIYCSPCHARTGDGDGMIVKRGFRAPPSLHSERVQKAKLGHYFDVITRGFGAMPGYAPQIKVEDRWAIAAYIRVLQLSQRAPIGDLPPEDRAKINDDPPKGAQAPTPKAPEGGH